MQTETKLTVRLPAGIKTRLQDRAQSNHRSANSELLAILERALAANAKEAA